MGICEWVAGVRFGTYLGLGLPGEVPCEEGVRTVQSTAAGSRRQRGCERSTWPLCSPRHICGNARRPRLPLQPPHSPFSRPSALRHSLLTPLSLLTHLPTSGISTCTARIPYISFRQPLGIPQSARSLSPKFEIPAGPCGRGQFLHSDIRTWWCTLPTPYSTSSGFPSSSLANHHLCDVIFVLEPLHHLMRIVAFKGFKSIQRSAFTRRIYSRRRGIVLVGV